MSLAIKNLTKEELMNKYFEQEELINKLNKNINSLSDELSVSINLFENSPTPMWEEDITELINYIEEIKSRSDTNFKEYLDENPNELSVCIKKIKPVNVNNSLVKLHKAKSKEELLNNLDQVFIKEAMPAFKDEIIAIANGETSFVCLTKAKTFTNEILDLKLYLQITKAKSESSIKYTTIISTVNITDQKKTEGKLLRSEKTLRTILDASEDIAILLDPNGFILESNKACQDFYKVNKIDFDGRKLKHFASKEVVEDRKLYFNRAKNEKRTIIFKNTAYDKIWISTISPILDVNGEVEKLAIFHKDVTSKHYSEIKLRDSELKFKSIFNNIKTSITHINNDGFITDINDFHINKIASGNLIKNDFIGKNILERNSIIKAGILGYYKDLLVGKEFHLKSVYFPETTGGKSHYMNVQGIPLFIEDVQQGAIISATDITQEVLSNQKLAKTEQQLSIALEGAEFGLWEHNIVTDKVWRSDSWFSMLGYNRSDFNDSSEVWYNLIHPDELVDVKKAIIAYRKQETTDIKIEHRLKNVTGDYQWILNWGKVIERDIKGNSLRATGVHLDITELKEAHQEILKSQKRYKYLFENQPTIIWEEDFSIVKDKLDLLKNNGVNDFGSYFKENPEFVKECAKEIIIIEMNLASLKILEADSIADLFESVPAYFDTEEAWQVFGNELTALANGALNFESEICIKTIKGNKKYLYMILNVNPENKNDLKSVLVSFQDITHRKNAEKRNKYLATLLESSPLAYTVTDLEGSITDVNPALEELTGYTKNELMGKNPGIFNADKNAQEIQNNIFETLSNNKVWDGEILNKKKNGELFYNHSTIFPLINESGEPYSFAAFNEDVTERILANNTIKEQDEYVNSIFSSAPVGIGVVINRVFNKVNLKLCKMTGYKEEELIGKSSEILYPTLEEFNRVGQQKYSQIEHTGSGALETKFKTKEGNIINVLLSSTPIDQNDLLKGVTFTALDITDRIKAEQQVRESEEKFHKIFRNSPDAIVLTKLSDGEIVEVNDATLQITEIKLEDLIGKKTTEVLIWENLADREKYVEKLSKSSMVRDFDTNLIIGEGEIRNCLISGELIKINNIDYILGIIRDVTEKKKADKALVESEEKYRLLVENQTDLVVEISKLNQFTFVSKSYCELFGRNEADLIGNSFFPLIHEDDRALTEREMKKLFFSPYTCRLEQRAMTAKGWRWLEWNDTAKLDETNNVKSIMGVGRDITEKKEAEIALKASEEKFYKIFKNSPDAIILSRMQDGEIIDVNDSTTEIIGYERSEIIGKRTTQINLWHSKKDRVNYINLLKKHGIAKSLTVEFLKKDGVKRIGMLSGVLLNLNNEKYVFGILRDITEKTTFEKKLQETNERLRNLTRYTNKVREEERKNFAREVHDNLGQKLTALNLDISWIKQNIPDELVEISKQFDPVLDLINQSIITVQKISTELRPGILDDLGLVNAIQWQSNEISRRTELKFSLNLYKHEIELDDNVKTALFRVFQEALTNIVRHANAGNVLVNLLIKEKKLIFEVIDDGKGISESEINEFTSLGIIGIKERIASIDGEIIFSRLTKGTMIQIIVPIKV